MALDAMVGWGQQAGVKSGVAELGQCTSADCSAAMQAVARVFRDRAQLHISNELSGMADRAARQPGAAGGYGPNLYAMHTELQRLQPLIQVASFLVTLLAPGMRSMRIHAYPALCEHGL